MRFGRKTTRVHRREIEDDDHDTRLGALAGRPWRRGASNARSSNARVVWLGSVNLCREALEMTDNPCPGCVETIANWGSAEIGSDAARRIRDYFRPKSPAQALAEECPHTDKVDVIGWMMERLNTDATPQDNPDYPDEISNEQMATIRQMAGGRNTPTDAAPPGVSERAYRQWLADGGESGLGGPENFQAQLDKGTTDAAIRAMKGQDHG